VHKPDITIAAAATRSRASLTTGLGEILTQLRNILRMRKDYKLERKAIPKAEGPTDVGPSNQHLVVDCWKSFSSEVNARQ